MDRRRWLVLAPLGAAATVAGLAVGREALLEKRVRVVVPGRLIRGAWQNPGPLRRLVRREGVRTIVTLTAINRDDPKYVAQRRVVAEAGIGWRLVPMRGSRGTVEQLAAAADLLADPALQPVFFHCVGGHHRTNLTHAAYRIRREGWGVDRAWSELLGLPWTRPEADAEDLDLLRRFAAQTGGDRPEEGRS